ncbi:MAG: hypothetical protein KDA91_08895 [Planctomycetaceae bacterium]|nr:hypothetical protein [Planctomycetaceae bacterium]
MSSRKLPWYRKLAFISMTLTLVWGIIELISLGGLHVCRGEFTFAGLREEQRILAKGARLVSSGEEVIHPYLGWIKNPDLAEPEQINGREIRVNALGFRDDGETIYQRNRREFLLGIAGGSVASNMSWDAEDLILELLSGHSAIQGRSIRIIRMATPGYKQPQQLQLLTYLLALGGEFDAVINLDGFNEATLAVQENAKNETAIAYPRGWHTRTITMFDPKDSKDAFALLEIKATRQRMAQTILQPPWCWSPACNLFWLFREQQNIERLTDLGVRLFSQQRTGFGNHGPLETFTSEEDMADKAAELWFRSSLQMQRLCAANGIIYLHALQPDQYVQGSKPLTEAELSEAYAEDAGTLSVVRLTYPRLMQLGRMLTEEGVAFSDQTMVFKEVNETLYIDPWCHVNKRGSEILATSVLKDLMHLLEVERGKTSE